MREFSRKNMLADVDEDRVWDIVVIGGGATGLGAALDAASRGYSTLLLEQNDFAKGTSSRSTKLVHGGVRYLAQGNIRLIREALRERGILLENAPHIVKPLSFIIPCFNLWERIMYTVGLMFYDQLSGKKSFGRSVFLKKETVMRLLPGINARRLNGGVQYFDGQFDDARLAINIAQTASELGATVVNYCRVTGLHKEHQKINAVAATDLISGRSFTIRTKAVVNATGVFVDEIMKMDDPARRPAVTTSQGTHIVIGKKFLPSSSALMIPKTADGRVIFALPWHDHLLVGTTDNLQQPPDPLEPVPLQSEIKFLLDGIAGYLSAPPSQEDILAVFAGLRPLAAPSDKKSTKEISRDHKIIVSGSGMVSVTGGKWTTYRKMAEEVVDAAVRETGLSFRRSDTQDIHLHGYAKTGAPSHLAVYGADEKAIRGLAEEDEALAQLLVKGHPYIAAEVLWAVRHEMAMTVEDMLARRIRLLFIDARAALAAAPQVAELMMKELHLSEQWKRQQVEAFNRLAAHYLIS